MNPFAVQLLERSGAYFVAIKQPPHIVFLPVASAGAGRALMASIRALVDGERVAAFSSSRAGTSGKA